MIIFCKLNKVAAISLISWVFGIAILLPFPGRVAVEMRHLHDQVVKQNDGPAGVLSQKVEKSNLSEERLNNAIDGLWIRWWAKIVWITVALMLSVYALSFPKYWRMILGALSISYLIAWILPYMESNDSFVRNFYDYFQVTLETQDYLNQIAAITIEAVLPLLHLLVLVLLCVAYNKKGNNPGQTTDRS